jgi:hypothetical protein
MAKKTFRDIPPFIGADSKVERRRGITETERAFPLAVPTVPEPHMLVRPPVAAIRQGDHVRVRFLAY